MNDFNFFLPYLNKNKSNKDTNLYIIVSAIILMFFVGGTFLWNSISIIKLNKDINEINAQLKNPEKAEKLKKAEDISNKEKILNKYYDGVKLIVKEINKKDLVKSELLIDIASTLPKDVSFKSIVFDEQFIHIQGISQKRVSIAELQYNLKQLKFISDVQISSITDGSDGGYSFTLKCVLKDVEQNENE
ncbi:Tfp pilus assembly protein PilN [Clostridium sp. USBA 49]|jgi:Tfp pilus assembly protein PilN|uniref:PilN domain-containing protein n=1 Tax=Clostridium sp. USBA 49 TaxID=1881060 RepID=UPI0009999A67|nr:PilN domain-containing protein [Clostridium sp. USBA 49]SKA80369.1 Tfp pilus assembly protein PilN [Clostridium sp. USBA 49]